MATPSPRIEKILVPYDFGEPAARALTYARILVERLSASLELLHVVADPRLALLPLGPAEGGAYVPSPGLLDEITREGEAALDASGRPYLVWKVDFTRAKLGDMDTELFKEWFKAFVQEAGVTLHVETLYGENNHHMIESCFKGLARALRQAVARDPRKADAVPSTKGTLGGTLKA